MTMNQYTMKVVSTVLGHLINGILFRLISNNARAVNIILTLNMPRPPNCIIYSRLFSKFEFLTSEVFPLWSEQNTPTARNWGDCTVNLFWNKFHCNVIKRNIHYIFFSLRPNLSHVAGYIKTCCSQPKLAAVLSYCISLILFGIFQKYSLVSMFWNGLKLTCKLFTFD